MSLCIAITLGDLRGRQDLTAMHRKLGHVLAAVIAINDDYLVNFPGTPLLYKSGIRWTLKHEFLTTIDGKKIHRVDDVPTVLSRGGGKCDELSCWRVSELRAQGIEARPSFQWRLQSNGGQLYHVVVERRNSAGEWEIEDPSRRLGM